MSRVIRSGRNYTCFCGERTTNCGYTESGLYFCFTNRESKVGDRIPGTDGNVYIAVKAAKGHTATFKLDDSHLSSEQKQRNREEASKLSRLLTEHKQKALANELPAKQRDYEYRQILEQLTLTSHHKELLQSKYGLTEQGIIEGLYKSAIQWQPVRGDFSENLPGYNHKRKSLITTGTGIIAPIIQDGLITALELRLDELVNNQRYSSISSTKFTQYHIYGEIPSPVLHPKNPGNQPIWVLEGKGLKPRIANIRFDIPVLGYGRYWHNQPEHNKRFLPQFKELYGNKIILALDAGDIINQHGVFENWEDEYKFFQSQGFDVSFAWWWQVSKDSDDIDELENLDKVEFIDLDHLKEIRLQALGTDEQPESKSRLQSENNSDNIADQPSKLNQKQEQKTNDWEQLRARTATYNLTRKADLTIDSGYLPSLKLFDIPSPLIGIKGNCGAGKSVFISKILKDWGENVIQIAHLNNLLSNTAPKFDLMHHSELKEMGYSVSAYENLAITDISLAAKLDVNSWLGNNRFILILDEVEQVLKSIQLNKNLRGSSLRLKARIKLEWMIKNAAYVICSDRDLCDETIKYIEKIRGEKFYLIHHTEKRGLTKMPIKMVVNKDKSKVLQSLYSDIKKGLKVLIGCENRSDLIAIELELKKRGINDKEILTVHGENSNEKEIKKLIENIDKEYFKYRIFGYTSTLGTGISLDTPHFDKAYYFVSGDVLQASEIIQKTSRYRLDVDTTIWCNPIIRELEINPNNLLKDIQLNLAETRNLINSIDKFDYFISEGIFIDPLGTIPSEDIPWIEHKLSILARLNASRSNPSKSLYDELIKDGYTVIWDDGEVENNYLDAKHKENKEEIKLVNDEGIAKTEIMSDDKYQNARLNPGSLDKEEQKQFQKTRLVKELGIHETEIKTELVTLERTKGVIRGANLLKIITGSKDTALAHDLKDLESNPDPFDRKYYTRTWQYFHDLGFDKFLDEIKEDFSYSKDSKLVVEIAQKARESAAKFKRVIGIDISKKKSDCAIIGHLLDKLCILREKPGKGKNKARIYKIDMQHYQLLINAVGHINKQEKTLTLEKLVNSKIDQTMVSECADVIRLAFDVAENPIDEYEKIASVGEDKPKVVKKLIFNQLNEDEKARIRDLKSSYSKAA